MEVPAQPPAVILVRVAEEQRVDVEPSRGVPNQLVAQLRGDVGRIVIGIVGGRADVHVDQYPVASLGLDERHVAVADREERKLSSHGLNLRNGTWGSLVYTGMPRSQFNPCN